MMTWRTLTVAAAVLVLPVGPASGQTTTDNPSGPSPDAAQSPWSFNASAYTYLIPDSEDFVNPKKQAPCG